MIWIVLIVMILSFWAGYFTHWLMEEAEDDE